MENYEDVQMDLEVVTASYTDLITLNHNIVSGSLFITGCFGITIGCLLGIAFHGIFRSK